VKAEIDAIVNNIEKPTFENRIATLSFSGDTLDRISNIFFHLNPYYKLLFGTLMNPFLSNF
jgi:Zn-dependent oligopeptidase